MAPNVHSQLQQQPLPTLTTQELEQIMELQRALNMDRAADGAPFPQSLQFLNSLNQEVCPSMLLTLFPVALAQVVVPSGPNGLILMMFSPQM